MDKELYYELREIEVRLYTIKEQIEPLLQGKLPKIWEELCDYLYEVKVKNE